MKQKIDYKIIKVSLCSEKKIVMNNKIFFKVI